MERGLFEGELEDECLKEGIGVIPYYSLASGFLSGKYRSEADVGKSPARRRREEVHQPQGHGRAEGARRRSQEAQRQPAQVALAWLMQRKSITAPIVSATSLQQLKDLIAAPDVKLDAADRRRHRQGQRAADHRSRGAPLQWTRLTSPANVL